jgi:hypothetical protein
MNLIESLDSDVYRLNGITVMSLDAFAEVDDDVEESLDEAPEDTIATDKDEPADKMGAQTRPLVEPELSDYLGRTKEKAKKKTDKYKMPYVHGSNIEIRDATTNRSFDTDKLMAQVMTRPKAILKQNQKMQHSDGTTSVFYNVGLPALKGLAVDEKKNEFVIVNTCPGAGVCKTFCYAMKGGYVQWKATSMGQSRMLNFLINDPKGFAAQMTSELQLAEKKAAKKTKTQTGDTKVIIRWHDAGDFFSPDYLALAYNIARSFPEVDFYAYTKIANVAQQDRPANFKMNFSAGALGKEERQIDFTNTKHSAVVPKDMFFDLIARDGVKLKKDDKGRMQFANTGNLQKFKLRMAKEYDVNPKSLITYDEMMSIPVGDTPKYNVIVMPGDGDDGANRADILGSFLLFH